MSDMKKSHDLVASVGKYTDNQGQEKTRFQKIGAAFTREDGSLCIKLEALPISQEWNGWANLYEPREEGQNG